MWSTIAGVLYINVGDAALVVFRSSIAYNYGYIKYVREPSLLRYWHGVQILYSADDEHTVYRTD